MPSPKTQPARGMRDFLPADVRKREYVISVIKQVYERYGFEPLETPAVENIETLMGKYGEEGNQLIFKILKRGEHAKTGEADLALRYDLTVPLARVVAQYQNELPKFFKRYQIQPVWRADRPARGRFREFYQCDVDVLGSRSMVVEAELIAAASDALVALGFNDFTIRVNHRELLTSVLKYAHIPDDQMSEVLITLDKLDKIGPDGVTKELRDKGFSEEAIGWLLAIFGFTERPVPQEAEGWWVSNLVVLEWMAAFIGGEWELYEDKKSMLGRFTNPSKQMKDFLTSGYDEKKRKHLLSLIGSSETARRAVAELYDILALANNPHIQIDPSLARGLSYYTGSIMEINVPDLNGSLGGGGRYDNLVGMFLGKDVPACGFSLGLERIIVVMSEREMFPAALVSSPADVMVTIWNEESLGESIALANELRSKGLRVDLYPEADKLAKQFKYASSRAIPFVAIIGEDERLKGEVAIKDMRSGEQRSVARAGVVDALQTLALRRRVAKPRSVGGADDSTKPGK